MAEDNEERRWRRFLRSYRTGGSAATFVDRALLVALLYTVAGVIYTAANIPLLGRLESLFNPQFTVFADLIAVAASVALWPILLASALLCDTAGCGVL
ncbi:hypothetical protein [Mycobacterium sp. SMC-4]|uniref:hypothetical protein n=1 Tax=Mycobacterium sp. SMC-4 TaxID=2857059 RepID=UPI0021B25ECC|nr:hypothetical protein [Mycobacterium sp. SMC-4]